MNLKIKIKKWKFAKTLLNKNYYFSRFLVLKYLSSKNILFLDFRNMSILLNFFKEFSPKKNFLTLFDSASP